jgi:hypothetical protein
MKKDFSFYEFVGILVPSVILLYSIHLIVSIVYTKQYVDFGKVGDTVIFTIICYGVGHIIQSLGNLFESLIWTIYGGMPSLWINKKNRFGQTLFDDILNQKILEKLNQRFGDDLKDYGRLTYNLLFQNNKTSRIDIFNGNYSLFRGLAISFLLISIMCGYYFNWTITLLSLIPFVLALLRMIRFAKYYATETYRTFYNMKE